MCARACARGQEGCYIMFGRHVLFTETFSPLFCFVLLIYLYIFFVPPLFQTDVPGDKIKPPSPPNQHASRGGGRILLIVRRCASQMAIALHYMLCKVINETGCFPFYLFLFGRVFLLFETNAKYSTVQKVSNSYDLIAERVFFFFFRLFLKRGVSYVPQAL